MAQQTEKELIYQRIEELQKEIRDLYIKAGGLKYVFELHTKGNFLWRLWFLISAPIIWLIKGEVKIK